MAMTAEEAASYVGGWVRVQNDRNEHKGAKLESVNGRTASVRFVGGKQLQVVELSSLHPWKSQNAQKGFVPADTARVRATPIPPTVSEPPAVKGGVIPTVASLAEAMTRAEAELDDMLALAAVCKQDYDAAKEAEDAARKALQDIRQELKLRLGL